MSEETRAPSSPDDIEVTDDSIIPPSVDGHDGDRTSEVGDAKAARRARRAKAKLALRIPDDEIARPQPQPVEPPPPKPNGEVIEEAIKPSRIIALGAPEIPEEQKTVRKVPSAPPTAPYEAMPDEALTPSMPAVTEVVARQQAKTVLDAIESGSDDIDVPVEEEAVVYRAKTPTIPSNPPPPPKPKLPSEDALEIDDVEAAAMLSSRPPPAPKLTATAPMPIPAAPRVPSVSSKPPGPPPHSQSPVAASVAPIAPLAPITPLIPSDAMSSTPHLDDRPRAAATALVDEDEARGIEEIEPDRQSAPPSIDSGDEIKSTDVLPAAAVSAPVISARPSTPPKPPAPKPPLPFRETLKDGAGMALKDQSIPPKEKDKERDKEKDGAQSRPTPMVVLSGATPAVGTLSPLAPPALADSLIPRRRARPWWEDLFNDDFIRTQPKFTEAQYAAEVDFIEDSLGVAKGGTLLDLGCGTGRHAIELTRRGYSVVGFDLSLAMLARAGEEAQERNQKINFVQGDMREMTFDEAFDGIYSWGSTFGYFEEEKNIHVLNKVHKALRHGGQFLLDVVGRDFISRQSPSLAWFEGEGCVCMDEMNVDWITSRMRIKRTMMLDDGRSKEIEYSIRIYALHELGKLLHDNGFRVAEVSGRIQTPGVFFGPESPRTLILAEKR